MSHLYLTRLVIETTSPMAINTGGRETGYDSQLARDANNLPYIPATSIAGVWQSIARQNLSDQGLDEEALKAWFGHTDNKNKEHPNQASSITLSDGVVLNNSNQPIQGLVTSAYIKKDEVLNQIVKTRPHHRERVSINDRGVAKDTGKFDQLLLPAGVRFCIDIKFTDQHLNDERIKKQWSQLLACWQHPLFCFGASTRNGLGKFKIKGTLEHTLNLTTSDQKNILVITQKIRDFAKRETIPLSLHKNGILAQKKSHHYLASLKLQAIDNWRCGSGSQLLTKEPSIESEHNINILSYSEAKFEWSENKGGNLGEPKAILCGSSIKGILAHRVAFHLRRLNAQWAEKLADASHDAWQERPQDLKLLFGYADEKNHELSLAGRLYVEDCELKDYQTVIRHHNSIDRFTGGVRQSALYSEELLYQPKFTLNLMLQADTELPDNLKKALLATLEDLKIGLLPMGAGSGRGTSLVQALDPNDWDIQKIKDIPIKAIEKGINNNEKQKQTAVEGTTV